MMKTGSDCDDDDHSRSLFLLFIGSSYAFPSYECCVYFDFHRGMALFFDCLNQAKCSRLAKVMLGNMDGAQWRRKGFTHRDVIKANNRNILGDAQACFTECLDRADGNVVIVRKVAGRSSSPAAIIARMSS